MKYARLFFTILVVAILSLGVVRPISAEISGNFFISCLDLAWGTPDWRLVAIKKDTGEKLVYDETTGASSGKTCSEFFCPEITVAEISACQTNKEDDCNEEGGDDCDRGQFEDDCKEQKWEGCMTRNYSNSVTCGDTNIHTYCTDSGTCYSHVGEVKSKTPFVKEVPVGILQTIDNRDVANVSAETALCGLLADETTSSCQGAVQDQFNFTVGSSAEYGGRKLVVVQPTGPVIPDASGNIRLPAVETYTANKAGNNHYLWGIQPLNSASEPLPTGDNNAPQDLGSDQSGLKLGTFGIPTTTTSPPQEAPDEGAVNCNSVHWDPYGRAVDVTTLLPISGVSVLLETPINGMWSKAATANANPATTRVDGMFFLIASQVNSSKDTSYRFNISKDGYSFPVNPALQEQAVKILEKIDPEEKYIKRDSLYRNNGEVFIEKASTAENKSFFMLPANPGYIPPSITPHVSTILTDPVSGNQIVRGYSWPLSQVTITSGATSVTTTAQIDGAYQIEIPASSIVPGKQLTAIATPVPIVPGGKPLLTNAQDNPFFELTRLISSPVFAAESIASYTTIDPLPITVAGFTRNDSLKIAPNATVDLIIPQLGGISYSTGRADSNGYVYFPKQYVPNMPFDVRISQGGKPVSQFSANEFNTINQNYTKSVKYNSYIPETQTLATEIAPNKEIIAVVVAAEPVSPVERAQITQNSRERIRQFQAQATAQKIAGSAGQQNQTAPTNANQQTSNPFALFFIVLVMIGVPFAAAFIYFRMKTRSQL